MNAVRAALVLCLALLAAPAATQERVDFGPFYYLPSEPDLLYLDGPIVERAGGLFLAVIDRLPDVTTLVLNTDEGVITDALVIADIVWYRRLDTFVPSGGICGGPCFMVLAAGMGRSVAGTLTIARPNDPIAVAYTSREVWERAVEESLRRFGGTDRLLEVYSALGPNDERTATEISLSLDRRREVGLAHAATEAPRPLLPPNALGVDGTALAEADATFLSLDSQAAVVGRQPGRVFWSLVVGEQITGLRAVAGTRDGSLVVGMEFWPSSAPGLEYISEHVLVDFWSNDATVSMARSVWAFGSASPGNDSYNFFYFTGTDPITFDEGMPAYVLFHALFPTVFSADTRSRLAGSEELILVFTRQDGTNGAVSLNVTEAVREAFATVLGASE